MLMPAAVLIVLVLGAISVDAAVRFQAQREAVADAQSIAHDAASAIVASSLRESGTDPTAAVLDPAEVERRISLDIHARRLDGKVQWRVEDHVVVVRVTRTTRLIFTPVVPGVSRTAEVTGSATALLVVQRPR